MDLKKMHLMQPLHFGLTGNEIDKIEVYSVDSPEQENWKIQFTGYADTAGEYIMEKGLWVFCQFQANENPLETLSDFWKAEGMTVMPEKIIIRTYRADDHDIRQIWWKLEI